MHPRTRPAEWEASLPFNYPRTLNPEGFREKGNTIFKIQSFCNLLTVLLTFGPLLTFYLLLHTFSLLCPYFIEFKRTGIYKIVLFDFLNARTPRLRHQFEHVEYM